jgi:hypothetical protein
MRFVGLAEIEAFIRDHPPDAEMVRAWVFEMKSRRWDRPEAVIRDHRGANTSRSPTVTFSLASAPVQIETLIDFRNSIVVLTNIQRVNREPDQLSVQHGNA